MTVEQRKKRYIILGGGIAGLASARELVRRGYEVVVLEKNIEVGGLARTLVFDGFRFDIGGHRFHSNNDDVVNWVKELLGSDLLTVPRISHIRMGKRYVAYPLEFPGALRTFDPLTAAGMVISYLLVKFQKKKEVELSFEDWVVSRFGWGLYNVYFKPYTEKVWGIPTSELSAMWAAQRIGIPSLAQAVYRMFFPGRGKNRPKTIINEFYYPRLGFGMITDKLREIIEAAGNQVIGGATVKTVNPDIGLVTYELNGAHHEVQGDVIISTLPLNLMLKMLPSDSGAAEVLSNYKLDYRDLIIVDLALKRQNVSNDSWTYFPAKELVFGRTHEPKNWSSEMVPSPDVTSLAVEIFATRGETVWEMKDDEIVNKVVEQMDGIGLIKKSELIKGWVFRVPFGYPVYRVGYEKGLKAVRDFLMRYPNLHLVGRTGSFVYINSDGVIEDVFRLMRDLFPNTDVDVHALEKETGRWI